MAGVASGADLNESDLIRQKTRLEEFHSMRGQDLFGLCRRLGLDRDESADAKVIQ